MQHREDKSVNNRMETANDVEGGLNPQAPEQSESEPITSQPTIEPYMASDATILDGDEMNQDSADEENDSETACPEEACVPNMPFGGIPTMAVRFFTTLTAGTIAIVMVFFYPLLFSLLILFAADVGKDGEATGLMGLIPTAHTRVSFLILGNAVGTGYVAWSPTLILCWKLIPVFSSRGLCKYVKHPAPFAPHLVLAAISAVGLTLAALIARAATSSGAQPCNMGNVSVWWTGRQPQTFMGCEDRLAPEQQALLREHVYQVQFPRVEHLSDYIWNATFDMDPFLQVHQNQTLCSRGFRGDQDLYGLGTRLGVYLLWLAGLVSNTLLPEKQDEPRKAWLFSSLIISSTCLVLSSTRECTFSTDITILYYMYWGGYLCVYTSVPGRAHVNGAPTWVRLNGARIARYVSAFFMLVHSMWFLWYGYDQVFARLPCGTWHLLPVSLMDPSPAFCTARDTLVGVTGPLYWLLSCAIPWFMMLFLSEIRHYFGKSLLPESEAEEDRFTSVARYLERRVMSWQGRYRVFRYWAGLPPHTRGGIYLVTPVGIKYRR